MGSLQWIDLLKCKLCHQDGTDFFFVTFELAAPSHQVITLILVVRYWRLPVVCWHWVWTARFLGVVPGGVETNASMVRWVVEEIFNFLIIIQLILVAEMSDCATLLQAPMEATPWVKLHTLAAISGQCWKNNFFIYGRFLWCKAA